MSEKVGELPSVAGSLALTFLSLGLVCLVAYVVLHWLARRVPRRGSDAMRVLARCQIETKRQLIAVEVAGRYFLLGSGEGGIQLVAELTADEALRLQEPPVRRLQWPTILSNWTKRAGAKDVS